MKTSTQFFLSLFLSFLWLCPTGAQAEEPAAVEGGYVFDDGVLTYAVTVAAEGGTNGAVTVKGFAGEAVAELVIPVTVKDGEDESELTYDIVAIRDGAFAGVTTLTSAKLNADGIEESTALASIGKGAFKGTGLTSVTFENATSLVTIGEGAFEGTKLTSVVLTGATQLKTIEANAFKGIALETVDLSWFTGLTEIGAGAFAGSGAKKLWLPESLVTVEEGAFENCTALAEAKFLKGNGSGEGEGKNLESIGKDAFAGCTGLGTVTLIGAASLTSIGEGVFKGCTSLISVVLTPTGNLTEIGDSAFAGCKALIPADFSWFTSLESIGEGAFAGSGVEKLWLPTSLKKIGEGLSRIAQG